MRFSDGNFLYSLEISFLGDYSRTAFLGLCNLLFDYSQRFVSFYENRGRERESEKDRAVL